VSAGHGSGGHGRRPKKHEEEEHENHERWAVSYADMMTVLVGLFIVLFAMSQVDQIKFEQLRQSLAVGFGHEAPSMVPGGSGAMAGVENTAITPDLQSQVGIQEDMVGTPDPTLTEEQINHDLAVTEYNRLAGMADAIAQLLAQQDLSDRVRFRITERGLVVGMVADDVFFTASSAQLSPTAQLVIDTTAPVLVGVSEEISVEGHANTLPPSSAYATNWELSADRATQVLRRLTEFGGVPANRIAAVGYGDARPLQDPEGDPMEANRRTDLVILSAVPEDVRAYLPTVAAEEQG